METWFPPSFPIHLWLKEVHVWRVNLALGDHATLLKLLSASEKERAQKFCIDAPRSQFIVSRACLRMILSLYQHESPREIMFGYNAYGKPELRSDCLDKRLHFNVSHSGQEGLYAITRTVPVGIDVEQFRPELVWHVIAEQCFSRAEVAQLFSLEEFQQIDAFFRCWTRKEAFIKAKGLGLSLPLSDFDVSVQPNAPAAVLKTRWSPDEPQSWTLADLPPMTGYAGTVAVQVPDPVFRYWQTSPMTLQRLVFDE